VGERVLASKTGWGMVLGWGILGMGIIDYAGAVFDTAPFFSKIAELIFLVYLLQYLVIS
jgi:hypothetical protein